MSKKLDKAYKNLGEDTVSELTAMDVPALKKRIVEAASAMEQVANELEANPEYQELKESLKAVTEGKCEVFKRQKSLITVAHSLIGEKGE